MKLKSVYLMDRLTNDVIRTGKKVINKNLKLVINTEFDILKDKIREKIIKDYVSISKKGVEEILEKTADSWKNEWFSKVCKQETYVVSEYVH